MSADNKWSINMEEVEIYPYRRYNDDGTITAMSKNTYRNIITKEFIRTEDVELYTYRWVTA